MKVQRLWILWKSIVVVESEEAVSFYNVNSPVQHVNNETNCEIGIN